MKCQKCGKNEATTHITKIINGSKTEGWLCSACANDGEELSLFDSAFDNSFDSFFSGLWQNPTLAQPKTDTTVCSICGTSVRDIKERGKLGCSECYNIFSSLLLRPLKEIHGSNTHNGKIPKRIGKGIRIAGEINKL